MATAGIAKRIVTATSFVLAVALRIYHSPTRPKSLQTPRRLLRERQITVIKLLNLFNVRNQPKGAPNIR